MVTYTTLISVTATVLTESGKLSDCSLLREGQVDEFVYEPEVPLAPLQYTEKRMNGITLEST